MRREKSLKKIKEIKEQPEKKVIKRGPEFVPKHKTGINRLQLQKNKIKK